MRAGWMRPSAMRLVQREAGDLAAHAVEAGEHHGLGRVVDDEVDAGDVLEGADVAALAADDAALHVVRGQVHDRDGRLGDVVGGGALDAEREDVAGAPVGLAARLLLDLRMSLAMSWRASSSTRASSASRACACVIAATRSSSRSCCSTSCVDASLALRQQRLAFTEAALARRDIGCELVELRRAGAEPLLGAGHLEAAALELLLDFAARREHVLLGGDLGLLADGLGFATGAGELALGLCAGRVGGAAAAAHVDDGERSPDGKSHKGQYCLEHVVLPGPAGERRAAPCSRASARHAGRSRRKAFRSLPGAGADQGA